MNPRARKFNVRPCLVCGYKFSDRHHLFPKRDGGKMVIFLCPNHHRYANIFQNIFHSRGADGEEKAREFAEKNFDKEFNERMLDDMITGYFIDMDWIEEQS